LNIYVYHTIVGPSAEIFLKASKKETPYIESRVASQEVAYRNALQTFQSLSDIEVEVLLGSAQGFNQLNSIFQTIASKNSIPYKGRVYAWRTLDQAIAYGEDATMSRYPNASKFVVCKLGPYQENDLLPDEDIIAIPQPSFSLMPFVSENCNASDSVELAHLQGEVFRRLRTLSLGQHTADVSPDLQALTDMYLDHEASTLVSAIQDNLETHITNSQLIQKYVDAKETEGISTSPPILDFTISSGYAPLGKLMLQFLQSEDGAPLLDDYRSLMRRHKSPICAVSVPNHAKVSEFSEYSVNAFRPRQNPTFWGTAAAGILFVCLDDETFLLLRRSPYVMEPGTWGIPGGSVQGEGFFDSKAKAQSISDDAFWEGATTETEEECGGLPQGFSQANILETIDYTSGNFKYRNFVCNITKSQKDTWTPTISLNWENIDAEWFTVEQASNLNLHFGVAYLLKELNFLEA